MLACESQDTAEERPPPCKKRRASSLEKVPSGPGAGKRRRQSLPAMPEGERVLAMRKKYLASSQRLHYVGLPLKIVKGQGQYFMDENGDRYLDTVNNVAHVGHCHPKVVEAATKQMSVLNTNSRFLNDKIVTYAKRLCATFPEKLTTCFFTNSGSEANDLALQIAASVTGNSRIFSLNGFPSLFPSPIAFLSAVYSTLSHRAIINVVAVARPALAAYLILRHLHLPCPDVYRGEFQDPEIAGELYASEAKQLIEQEEKSGHGIAAFIHEAILCCGGQIIPPKGYLSAVYSHVREAGGLCIADEVQVGFGRVGTTFWSFQLHGVCPDIVTIGKPMGNGHPVAAVITTKEIADKFASCGIEYFNTFGGNPVSMAIADAVLSVIEEEGLQAHAAEVGSYLLCGLVGLMERHPCIGDVRGAGLLIGVDLVKDRESKEPDSELGEAIVKRLLIDHNIIAHSDGLHGNVLKFKPPLCITKEDCARLVDALDSVLTSISH